MDDVWKKLVSEISAVFKLDSKQQKNLMENKAAKLVGLLPYLAGVEDKERKSLAYLSLYIAGSMHGRRLNCFKTTANDALNEFWKRLDYICPNDQTGRQHIITSARYRLMLLQICDHSRDRDQDKDSGKYNPFNCPLYSYNTRELVLPKIRMNQIQIESVDEILSIDDAKAGFWW